MIDLFGVKLKTTPLKILAAVIILSAVCFGAAAFLLDGTARIVSASACLASAVAFVLLIVQTKLIKQNMAYCDGLSASCPETLHIVYNVNTQSSIIPEELFELSGMDKSSYKTSDGYVYAGRGEYLRVIAQLTEKPEGDSENIYQAPGSDDKWYKVISFDAGSCRYTLANNASDIVLARGLIRSLRDYDSVTSLLGYEAFTESLKDMLAKGQNCCVVQFHINGLEKITSAVSYAAAEKVLIKIASALKAFLTGDSIAGRRNTNEFIMAINGVSHDSLKNMIAEVFSGVNKAAAQCAEELKLPVAVFCGYCLCPEQVSALDDILSAADFAAFEAESAASAIPQKFNQVSFGKRREDYHRIQVFDDLISGNEIDYWFQPIVDARTGEIHGYESLMRPRAVSGIKFTPGDVLSLAKEQNMLDEIERLTFFNTIAKVYENQDLFKDRKVFLNSIPSCSLTENDYKYLLENYEPLFGYLVVEITESSEMSLKTIETLRQRFVSHKSLLALDDYGTGYSNESNLLKSQPNYIKIDRSLLTGINSNAQKQHLVSNMISFASKHDIRIIAEGIETAEELETVINLGADLIQGFFTCRPQSVILRDIPAEIRELIVEINLRRTRKERRIFEANGTEIVDIASAALQGYTDIVVAGSRVTVTNKNHRAIPINFVFPKGSESTLTLDNITVESMDRPAIILEEGANVKIDLKGTNTITGAGVRVPAGSRAVFTGDGDLSVTCDSHGACIGGGKSEDFGEIVFNSSGTVTAAANDDISIAIGGGIAKGSLIKMVQGRIVIRTTGEKTIGMGFISGNCEISLVKGVLDIESSGAEAVGLGAFKGDIRLSTCADVSTVCSGDTCACIGGLADSKGTIEINEGHIFTKANAKNAVGIGGIGSEINTVVHSGSVTVRAEGGNICGIGDRSEKGSVTIESGKLELNILSGNCVTFGAPTEKTVVFGGNIAGNTVEDIKAVNTFGEPLTMHKFDSVGEFIREVRSGGGTYRYVAESGGNNEVNVFLPDNYEFIG